VSDHVVGGYEVASPVAPSGTPGAAGTSEKIISDRVVSPAEGAGESVPPPAAADDKTSSLAPADGGLIVVQVPRDAKVFINGAATTATGSVRRYVSRGFQPGKVYDFTVRMVVEKDGSPVEVTRTVSLSSGDRQELAFDAAATRSVARPATQPAKTSLTLRVPADAKVFLAGQQTAASGEIRRFETAALAPGQTWEKYEIRVMTSVNGEEQTSSRVIDLVGGDSLDLAISPAQAS